MSVLIPGRRSHSFNGTVEENVEVVEIASGSADDDDATRFDVFENFHDGAWCLVSGAWLCPVSRIR